MHARERAQHARASARRCCRRRRRRRAALERAVGLAQRQQVRERLAGVVAGAEHVDDRHRAVRGELLEHRVGPVRTPTAATWRESTSAVSRSASPRESWSSSERSTTGVAAQLVDADLEGHARAGRGLLEDQRHAAPGERLRGQRRAPSARARGRAARPARRRVSSAPVRKWRGMDGQSRLGCSRAMPRRSSATDRTRGCMLAAGWRLAALLRRAGCGSHDCAATSSTHDRDDRDVDERDHHRRADEGRHARRSSPRRPPPRPCRAGSCRSPTATSRSTRTRSG